MDDESQIPKILDDGLPATGTVRIERLYAVGGPVHGVSRSTVWKWIAEGRLATLKLSERVTVVQVASVRAFLKAASDRARHANVRALYDGNSSPASNMSSGTKLDSD
ncbi:hypothetical protein RPMA_19150 [Tardiphaga alba]|uniref:Helix-turn-helix domain-containing protein n=1 Tax=Tardiphaga alba TaxID=340268 RepID=A0ABX8AE66_9BRAD|nr:hypothetical protein [Tardiphaga alba]QUS40713.1 hypothetical protein RPMA_19150 [Tardiphaga alba]